MGPFYERYASNYGTAFELLGKLKKENKLFREFVQVTHLPLLLPLQLAFSPISKWELSFGPYDQNCLLSNTSRKTRTSSSA